MSRSNYGKPFYVDVGTSIVAIRCASNRDVLVSYDFAGYPFRLKLAKDMCDRMNSEFEAALKREKSAIEADALAVGGIVEAAKRGKAQFGAASGKASLNIAESRSGEEGAHPKTAESSPGAKGWNTPRRENWRDGGEGGRADSEPGTQTAGCASDPAPSSSAPAPSGAGRKKRNCDKYRTLTEALSASGEITAEAHGLYGMGNAQLVRFCKWLFCPAGATSDPAWRFVNKEGTDRL